MTDETHSLPQEEQPALQGPPASESFGDFGPLPTNDPYVSQPAPVQPVPSQPLQYPSPSMPGQALPYPPTPPYSYPPATAQQPYPYAPVPGQGMPYYAPGQPMPAYMPAPKVKAPIYFPIIRNMSISLQISNMLCYSLLMALSLMGILLYLTHKSQANLGVFVNTDSSVDGLAIFLVSILLILILPACSLLAGALFGSWRGFLVSLVSIGGGILITHLTNSLFWNSAVIQNYLVVSLFPVAALVVGWIYGRRKYAAWWKSMFSMMPGAGIISLGLAILLVASDLNSASFLTQMSASTNTSAFIAGLWVAGGCVFIGLAPLMTFPIAAIEGIIHACIVAAIKK